MVKMMTKSQWTDDVLQRNRGKPFTFKELDEGYAEYVRKFDLEDSELVAAARDLIERVDDGSRSVAGLSVFDGKTIMLKGSFLEAVERLRRAVHDETEGE